MSDDRSTSDRVMKKLDKLSARTPLDGELEMRSVRDLIVANTVCRSSASAPQRQDPEPMSGCVEPGDGEVAARVDGVVHVLASGDHQVHVYRTRCEIYVVTRREHWHRAPWVDGDITRDAVSCVCCLAGMVPR